MDTQKLNALMEEIRLRLEDEEEAEPGDMSVPVNPDGTADALDAYVDDVVQALLDAYELDVEDAVGFVLELAEVFAEEGVLPPFPDEEDPAEMRSAWLGKAKSVGFAAEVLQAASEAAE